MISVSRLQSQRSAPTRRACCWQADADKTNAAGAADVIAPAAASAVAEPGTGEAGDAAASPIAAQRDEHDGAKENVPGASENF